MRERRWPFGGMTTTPFDRTAHSIICRQPPTPKSPLLECNGTGRLRYAGAPRPVPLHHRAIRAQMKPGLYSSADEAWGSGHAPPGRRIVKVEPLPGSLVTVTSPPIMRASGNGKAEAGAAEALRRRLA